MARSPRIGSRRLPETTRRRLEVATAMAWESLVETHANHALQLITMLGEHIPLEESLSRYLMEMDLGDTMAAAIRTRVLVALEARGRGEDDAALRIHSEREEEAPIIETEGWRRFRPDVMVRGVLARQRRHDEVEGWLLLSLARAEEGVISTHVDNAITFAALLDEYLPLDRAVREYLEAVSLSGGRAQAVYQRAMARLADVHLPRPAPRHD